MQQLEIFARKVIQGDFIVFEDGSKRRVNSIKSIEDGTQIRFSFGKVDGERLQACAYIQQILKVERKD